MDRKKQKNSKKMTLEETENDKALKQAVHDALLKHKRAGTPIATWEDGNALWVPVRGVEGEE